MPPTPDTNAQTPDVLWVSISELATRKGVTKQTISERVGKLVTAGKLTTKPGKGKSKLVNLAEYDRGVGEITDLSKEQGAQTKAASKLEDATGRDPTFVSEQSRRAGYEAELKRLDLEERLGRLREVDEIVAAAVMCGETIVRELELMILRADEMAGAVAKDGVSGARAVLKIMIFDARKKVEEAFAKLASGADAVPVNTDQAETKQ